MGIGSFFGSMPISLQNSKRYGVELDRISGRIARQLYQTAKIQITGFEKTAFQADFFDVVIGNVPFGDYKAMTRPTTSTISGFMIILSRKPWIW